MIPIILLNRDRLSTTERLVDQLLMLGYEDITILDMDSTYKPLLDYYDQNISIKIITHENRGHKVLWQDGILTRYFSNHQWVCVSDSDIELSSDTPKGFIEDMICVAKDFRVDKVGLAIEYRDITNQYLKDIIAPIESRYWEIRLPHITHEVYSAPTDTTMCVIRPELPFTYRSVRLAGEYTCRHIPWYEDYNNLTPEQQYYHDHADPLVATGTSHYRTWLTAHQI